MSKFYKEQGKYSMEMNGWHP